MSKKITNKKGERLYYFRWTTGGYNSGWAKSKKGLVKVIASEFPGSIINMDSIVHVDERLMRMWDYEGMLMTC